MFRCDINDKTNKKGKSWMWKHHRVLNRCHSPEMEGKAIGKYFCMNVCLSTVWFATAFWFTCMPLSNGPDIHLLTEYFYFWCLIVTSQPKSQTRSVINTFLSQVINLWNTYFFFITEMFPFYNSILEWTLWNLLTSKCLENNLFRKIQFSQYLQLARSLSRLRAEPPPCSCPQLYRRSLM